MTTTSTTTNRTQVRTSAKTIHYGRPIVLQGRQMLAPACMSIRQMERFNYLEAVEFDVTCKRCLDGATAAR